MYFGLSVPYLYFSILLTLPIHVLSDLTKQYIDSTERKYQADIAAAKAELEKIQVCTPLLHDCCYYSIISYMVSVVHP